MMFTIPIKDIDDLCAHDIISSKYDDVKGLNEFIRFVGWIFFDIREFHLKTNMSKVLIFLSYSTETRKDRQDSFERIMKCAGMTDVLSYRKRRRYKPSPLRGVILFFMSFIWFVQVLQMGIRGSHVWIYLRSCVILKKMFWKLDGIDISNYKCVVVYYDADLFDGIICRYFKRKGVTTVSAAHAMFVRKYDDCGEGFEGIELTYSPSDYFMAWNNYMRDEAIACGMSKEKIKVLGIPKFIDFTYNEYASHDGTPQEDKVFGVVLSIVMKENYEENVGLIQDANWIAEMYNYKYVLRYHPGSKGNEYDRFVDKKFYIGNSDENNLIAQYANGVCFSLVGGSSVFVELIFLGKTAFHKMHTVPDRYGSLKTGCYSDHHELNELIECNPKHIIDELFEYYCTVKNPGKSYRAFFSKFQN